MESSDHAIFNFKIKGSIKIKNQKFMTYFMFIEELTEFLANSKFFSRKLLTA